MILIEPTIQARFGRALRRKALSGLLTEAAEAMGLRGDVSVLLTGDAQIRRLNRQFRGKDTATDVLSFPAPDSPDGYRRLAGDLAISVETAARQAEEFGHSLATELQILALHGVLHLGGLDHESDTGQMARKEAVLRRNFGLTTGLIERAGRPAGAKTGSRRRRRP
jgi:probable rRNA maturation factor